MSDGVLKGILTHPSVPRQENKERGAYPRDRMGDGDSNLSQSEVADQIGKEYIEMDAELTEEAKEAAYHISANNEILWAELLEKLDYNITITPEDPYDGFEEMCRDIEENQRLKVYSGGTHPIYHGDSQLRRQENIRARAIHDYWGHYLNDAGFTLWGEFISWHHQKEQYPEITHRYLFADIVGQTALAYHLDDGFDSPDFEQKPIVAPQKWIELCYDHCPVDLE